MMGAAQQSPAAGVSRKGRQPRIYIPLDTTVEGVNQAGAQFRCRTVLDNLSKEGLYLRLQEDVAIGSRVTFVIQLSKHGVCQQGAGTVLRVEQRPDGKKGVAIKMDLP